MIHIDKYMLRSLLSGILSYSPLKLNRAFRRPGKNNVRAIYCYEVWLKHLIITMQFGLKRYPEAVVELGPGDSIGVGLAALISGVKRYIALDVFAFADLRGSLAIFDELVELFKTRKEVPYHHGVPDIRPYLNSRRFPEFILPDSHLNTVLSEGRLLEIKDKLRMREFKNNNGISIYYIAPYSKMNLIEDGTVDMIFSHAVLEHVDNLEIVYKGLGSALKKDGFSTHQIDFRSHNTAKEWNGYWKYSDAVWKLIRGKKSYLINRQPYSKHLEYIKSSGLGLIFEEKIYDYDGIARDKLAGRWTHLADDDISCKDAFIGIKKSK